MTGDEEWPRIRSRFISDFGHFFEMHGSSEIMGWIVGALTFAAEPLPLPELAQTLRVSKAAVSIHIRTLRQIGLVEKVSFPGDRRDFYLLHRDFERGMLDSTVKEVRDGVYILDKTLAALADRAADPDEIVTRRLASLRNLYSQVGRMIEELCRDWPARKG